MKMLLVALAAVMLATPTWADCPPECPYKRCIKTTLTPEEGEIERKQ